MCIRDSLRPEPAGGERDGSLQERGDALSGGDGSSGGTDRGGEHAGPSREGLQGIQYGHAGTVPGHVRGRGELKG